MSVAFIIMDNARNFLCNFSIGCGPSGPAVTCGPDLCKTSSCEAHDNSVCEIDSCSNCTVKHYVGLQEVTEQCGRLTLIHKC